VSADSKYGRNEATSTNNTQLNSSAAPPQLSQQQQQPPINLIPNLNNFPFFFHNYGYPNMYMPIPNGSQAANQQQYQQNKPPYNFTNSTNYDEQNKEYSSYNPQAQIKSSASNLGNVADMGAYSKNTDKQQTNPGYHTPPPNFSNSLLNQQSHSNLNSNSAGGPPPAQYTYMIGAPGPNQIVHPGIQDNLNTRNVTNNGNATLKQMPNYQNKQLNQTNWGQ
jgi:hypothetical protein